MPAPMHPTSAETAAAILFGVALAHTFSTKLFERLAHRFPRHAGLFHLLGEVEVVFGFWAIVLILIIALLDDGGAALNYAESRRYTEPMFVFVVMVVAASRPILQSAAGLIDRMARILPVRRDLSSIWLGLVAVPLLGSAITEPAAMTLAALILAPKVFRPEVPERAKYLVMGVLFVNVSIGGTLTSFAAPPVLMVASVWGWDSLYMATTFGHRAAIGVLINASLAIIYLQRHMAPIASGEMASPEPAVPRALVWLHAAFLAAVVLLSHHPVAFVGLFLLFLGVTHAYARHQSPLIIKEALLVAFFLAGLVVLGGLQQWWLQPLISGLSPRALFVSTVALTAVTDNAALTYLGSLIEGLSSEAKYSLVAGAVAGGGLTVMANAPNPAGVALLKKGFADESVGALELLAGASLPTLVAVTVFLLL